MEKIEAARVRAAMRSAAGVGLKHPSPEFEEHVANYLNNWTAADRTNRTSYPVVKAHRHEVYDAIDTERDYQNRLARNTEKYQEPLEHLTIIRRIVRDMEDSWYDNPGKADMNFMRKIAGVAVRAMEQHGAPKREVS